MKYEVACSCGKTIPVSEGLAGSSTSCTCGRMVHVPTLSECERQAALKRIPGTPPSDQAPLELPHSESRPPLTKAERSKQRLAEFKRALAVLTPRAYVTPALIGVNVFIFIAMAASGVSIGEPNILDLLHWGANFGPMTISGEWWRLFTCMFIHIGIIHLAFNMWVLAVAGPLVERMIGGLGFILLYVVAGLSGSLASTFWNPLLVSAGASGAIFGIYGALLGLLLCQRGSVPKEALEQLRNSGLGFLFYNLIYGMTKPNIDIAAHIGGLVGGFLGGIVLSQPFTVEALAGRPKRNLWIGGLGALLVMGGMVGVYGRHGGLANVQSELDRFGVMEKKTLDAVNDAAAKAQRQEMSPAGVADILECDVLPQWRAERERLSALMPAPQPFQAHVASIVDYMRLREQGWELFIQAMREDNQQKAEQAQEKQKLADAAAKKMSESGGK